MRLLMRTAGLCVLMVAITTQTVRAEFWWRSRAVGLSGGYDSNVNRVSADSPPPGVEMEPDVRVVTYGAFAVGLSAGTRFESSFDVRPYYVKYGDEVGFDRGDILAAGAAKLNLSSRWWIEASDGLRQTTYPNRDGWNRRYNSLRTKVIFRPSSRWWSSVGYRNLYRENPRKILHDMYANGVSASVNLSVSDRLSIAVLGQVDFQTIQFVFPRRESGERMWIDISTRYLVGHGTLVLGKYLFAHDDMGLIFTPGASPDKLGDPAEDATDGIFQSLRFLEDTDFNFSKHLAILSSHTLLREGTSLNLLVLYQYKKLKEKVLELPDRPQRRDHTVVLQAGFEHELRPGLVGVLHGRFEDTNCNDPDYDFEFLTIGLGIRLLIGASE